MFSGQALDSRRKDGMLAACPSSPNCVDTRPTIAITGRPARFSGDAVTAMQCRGCRRGDTAHASHSSGPTTSTWGLARSWASSMTSSSTVTGRRSRCARPRGSATRISVPFEADRGDPGGLPMTPAFMRASLTATASRQKDMSGSPAADMAGYSSFMALPVGQLAASSTLQPSLLGETRGGHVSAYTVRRYQQRDAEGMHAAALESGTWRAQRSPGGRGQGGADRLGRNLS